MSEIERPTFEQACICPKCKQPGQERQVIAASRSNGMRPGSKAHMIYCNNEKCRWYNTPWTVETLRDGSVPAPKDHTKQPKTYVGFEGHDAEARQILDALEMDKMAQQQRGSEVRRHGI